MSQETEERIAHLERMVDDLSDTVATQDKEILRLTRLVELLAKAEAARQSEGSGGAVFADERPPHY